MQRLLFIGISLMLVALITLTGAFYGYHTDDGDDDGDDDDDEHKAITARQAVILFAMFVYIGGYQIGFGPISWLMISEIFPLEVRGQAVSVSVQANFLFNLIVAYLFPVELDLIGIFFTFAIFAVIDAYALFFVFRYVPETKVPTPPNSPCKYGIFSCFCFRYNRAFHLRKSNDCCSRGYAPRQSNITERCLRMCTGSSPSCWPAKATSTPRRCCSRTAKRPLTPTRLFSFQSTSHFFGVVLLPPFLSALTLAWR